MVFCMFASTALLCILRNGNIKTEKAWLETKAGTKLKPFIIAYCSRSVIHLYVILFIKLDTNSDLLLQRDAWHISNHIGNCRY